jgi:ABC-type multidrug transport system fused ATPase/permease subunit
LSALDYQTDLNLRRALQKERAETTVILISQRVSSIATANQILVLDSGKARHGQWSTVVFVHQKSFFRLR